MNTQVLAAKFVSEIVTEPDGRKHPVDPNKMVDNLISTGYPIPVRLLFYHHLLIERENTDRAITIEMVLFGLMVSRFRLATR